MYKISFNVGKALGYLKENGYVYTLRPTTYRSNPVKPSSGEREIYVDGKGIGLIVNKQFVKVIKKKEDLNEEYVKHSGFKSAEEWIGYVYCDPPLYLFRCDIIEDGDS